MQLPFTTTEFIHVFESYNAAIGFAPLVAYALAIAAVGLVLAKKAVAGRLAALLLAGFWAFTGVAYHLLGFSAINPGARMFGAAFVVQAVLFAVVALRARLTFRYAGDARSKAGVAMIAWAMVGYPLAGFVFGHGYPHGPVFALAPCPLVIFTFGMFMLARRVPLHLVVIPALWATLGTTAAFALGIREDLTLVTSAAVFLAFEVAGRLTTRRGHARPAGRARTRPFAEVGR